jgi:palmitoyltransferase ZDHHC13/17
VLQSQTSKFSPEASHSPADEASHCPWVNNCVANNNHRHFVLYVICMELGVLVWVRLLLDCKSPCNSSRSAKLIRLDLDIRKHPKDVKCNILSEDLCEVLYKDPITIILSIWTAMQLTWVTMLLCVQLLQIARNLTTYESMHGHLNSHTPAEAVTSFVTTGDTSQDVAGGSAPTTGFGSGADTEDAPRRRKPKQSVWDQWKRLLGIDTFVATALHGSQANQRQQRGNPFSRGVIINCKDFWCDGAPMLQKKESGYARLGGDRVDYTRLYEVPKMRYQRGGGRYEAVAAEEQDGD